MNSRIKRFMDYRSISSSELADSIGVQRSNVTHVLHGRNKPSFQFISKLLETYPEISAKWLIMGNGNMLEHGKVDQQQLFPEDDKIKEPEKEVKTVDEIPSSPKLTDPFINTSTVPPNTKEIERIVVFYTDRTFKEYGPAK